MYPMPYPMMPSSNWSLLEIVGVIAVMFVAWIIYRRYQLIHMGGVPSPGSLSSPLGMVRAPPLERPPTQDIPPQIKRSLPPTVPLAITQQPSRYGDMFVKWSDDLIKTLFQTDPPRVQGRT